MCGIIGVVNLGSASKVEMKNFLQQGMIANSLRGDDGTGMLIVSPDGLPDLYKKTIPGWDFFQLHSTQKMLEKDIRFAVIHNRAGTRGNNNDILHTHPVTVGDITLVHNGTLTSTYNLLERHEAHDTTAIATSMHNSGEARTLSNINGSFVLVWYNNKDKTLNFARNSERPLFFGYQKNNDAIYFASEDTMLSWLADRLRIDLKAIKPLKELTWHKFPLSNKELPHTQKFAEYTRPSGMYQGASTPLWQMLKSGVRFKAIYQGEMASWRHNGPEPSLKYHKFKHLSDPMYGWIVPLDEHNKNLYELHANYLCEALDSRTEDNKTANLYCKVIERTTTVMPSARGIQAGILEYYTIGDTLSARVIEIRPYKNSVNSGSVILLSEDTNEVEIRSYKVGIKNLSIGDNVSVRISGMVHATNKSNEHLIGDGITLEIGGDKLECEWCKAPIHRFEAKNNKVDFGGTDFVICSTCKDTCNSPNGIC